MRTQMWGSGAAVADVQSITGIPTTITTNGQSSPIDIAEVGDLMASVKVANAPTGGSPSLHMYVEMLDALGDWLVVLDMTPLTAAGYTYGSTGPGSANAYVLTNKARFRWVVAGSFTGVSVGLAGR